MITETRLNRFLGRSILFFRLSSKSCITTLYVDVKEPAPRDRGAEIQIQESLPLLRFKTVIFACLPLLHRMVGVAGFEPATLRLSSACSNQLSYTPYSSKTARTVGCDSGLSSMVEVRGLEPLTYSLQSYRSTN
jgi:hypothetical protein